MGYFLFCFFFHYLNVWRGCTGFTLSVRPSVCPSVRLSICLSLCLSVDDMVSRAEVKFAFHVDCSHRFSVTSLPKWPPGGHFEYFGFRTLPLVWLWISTPPGGHIGFLGFWTLYASWFLEFALDFQYQISCACCLWLWAEAYWFLTMSPSKWVPGSHIGFFGFWTVTLV